MEITLYKFTHADESERSKLINKIIAANEGFIDNDIVVYSDVLVEIIKYQNNKIEYQNNKIKSILKQNNTLKDIINRL